MNESVACIAKIDNICFNVLEPAEEVTDDESLTRFKNGMTTPLQCSSSSVNSCLTVMPFNEIRLENNGLYTAEQFTPNNLKVPIVGYEVMEERARFTVYKLRVEYSLNGNSWFVYRRYTDFVRLCTVLKSSHPNIAAFLPRKRWFGNNFDPDFLNERVKGLQQFINAILTVDDLLKNTHVQDFLCLNDSPLDTEKFLEDSRAMCDALSDTIYQLRNQLKQRDMKILELNQRLCSQELVLSSCTDFFKNHSQKCSSCLEELQKTQELNHILPFSNI